MISIQVVGVTCQNLTICRNPRIGLPCLLTCVTPSAVDTVTFLQDANEKKSCSYRANTNDCETKRSSDKTETILRLPSLHIFDQGHWQCEAQNIVGTPMHLKPYSFEKAEIITKDFSSGHEQQKIFTVKADCAYPGPKFVIKYCSKVRCQGKGKTVFTDCGDKHIQNYNYSCKIDFENPSTECQSTDPVPVQALIYVNDHQVFNEFTVQSYNGKERHDDIYIYKPLFITILVGVGLGVILSVPICSVLICRKRRSSCCSDSNNGNQVPAEEEDVPLNESNKDVMAK